MLPLIQDYLELIHDVTGMPWWASVALAAVSIRVALVPFFLLQMRNSMKIALLRPYFEMNSKAYHSSVLPLATRRMYYVKNLWTILNSFQVSLWKSAITPILAIPIFISFSFAARDMVFHHPEFAEGGTLWFVNLTQPDASYALPAIAVSLSYLAMEISSRLAKKTLADSEKKLAEDKAKGKTPVESGSGETSPDKPGIMTVLLAKGTTLFQGFLIVCLPLTTQFPVGIFMYWIPSSLWGILQSLLLKQEWVRAPILRNVTVPGINAPLLNKSSSSSPLTPAPLSAPSASTPRTAPVSAAKPSSSPLSPLSTPRPATSVASPIVKSAWALPSLGQKKNPTSSSPPVV